MPNYGHMVVGLLVAVVVLVPVFVLLRRLEHPPSN